MWQSSELGCALFCGLGYDIPTIVTVLPLLIGRDIARTMGMLLLLISMPLLMVRSVSRSSFRLTNKYNMKYEIIINTIPITNLYTAT